MEQASKRTSALSRLKSTDLCYFSLAKHHIHAIFCIVIYFLRVYNDLMGQRTDTAKLNWLVYKVGSYGIIEHSLSDPVCVAWFEYHVGYLATLVPVWSKHRA